MLNHYQFSNIDSGLAYTQEGFWIFIYSKANLKPQLPNIIIFKEQRNVQT